MSGRPLIVLDGLALRAKPSGVGRAVLELTDALAATDRGLDFLILTTQEGLFEKLRDVPGWRVRVCREAAGGIRRKAWFTHAKLPALCRREGADLLHCLQFVAPWRSACPTVVTVHDLAWQLVPEAVEQPRRTYYRACVPRSLARADHIVTNSAATAREVARLYPGRADRVTPTPFGTPAWIWEALAQGGVAGSAAAPAADRAAPFLFVGTLEPRKNLPALLEAYERFLAEAHAEGRSAAEIPDLHLVGSMGWSGSALRARMESLEGTGRLRRLGYREGPDLLAQYRLARGLLFPSLHEGFGFPILEAMAAGLPVLTADRGATAEVAGDCALLVDPRDPQALLTGLRRLAWDSLLQKDLRRRGPARARVWNWERTAELTCAVYERVLAERNCSPLENNN